MTTNQELAEIFRSIGDILDLEGERFKPEAYRRAARSIETLAEDIRRIADRNQLDEIPGVGEAIAEKVREYLRTGKIQYYERVQREIPPGVLEIMRLPGVGPKTARRFLVEFGIEGPQELTAAIDAGRFRGAKGFGDRKLELLRQALEAGSKGGRRIPLLAGWTISRQLVAALTARAPVDRIEVAGSLRRRRESVGDLDVLVTSRQPEAVLTAFGTLPEVREVKLRGSTKETVLVGDGLQVDLRVVEPEAFGAALQYFTGSKDHNVHLRTLARDRGLKVNEYGVFRGEERIAGRTEEEVYAALDLPWIPPEMREDRGEIDAALAHRLPPVVEPSGLVGDLHVHLSRTASPDEVDRRLEEAKRRGWAVLGFTLPLADVPSMTAVVERIRSRSTATDGRAAARWAVEVTLGSPADPLPAADYVLADASGLPRPPDLGRKVPALFLTHLALGPPGSEGTPDTTRSWVEWAKARGVGLEVSPLGASDGLDATGVRHAAEVGGTVHLTAGVRTPTDEFDRIDLSVGTARRGWLPPTLALNREVPATRPAGLGRKKGR